MLNYRDQALQKIATSALSAQDARIKITEHYAHAFNKQQNSALWAQNEAALANLTTSYTTLLADKLYQALSTLPGLDKGFAERLWLAPQIRTSGHSQITVYLASAEDNLELLVIDSPLLDSAALVARNLPTLLQVTAKEDVTLPFDDNELAALSVLIKGLYDADFAFKTVDETVLQPVDGLTFQTKYDNTRAVTTTKLVEAAGELTLGLDLAGATPLTFHVLDDAGHDWMDLGTEAQDADAFSWASTTIPEELVGHKLTLQVLIHAGENAPALDELFVIASNHAILMRQGKRAGSYDLALPNHQSLSVITNTDSDTITLRYPETDVQIMELNHQYPFIGEWLKTILPQKRAFN
ncbi:MAG: hypothetical protein LKJ69_07640 [Lactobacillus sp.]|jgi:hypothetical protein|nr:hypothetical protein [Lactobacillus sp.]MCI2033264.1 hypothetical protein [Lactobacillus sp.]